MIPGSCVSRGEATKVPLFSRRAEVKNTIPALVVALMWLGSATIAQTPPDGKVGVDVTGNPQAQALMAQILALEDGTYELVLKDGVVTIVPLTWITPDDPTPPPSDLTQRGKEIKGEMLAEENQYGGISIRGSQIFVEVDGKEWPYIAAPIPERPGRYRLVPKIL
jgi:hypothetical protein